ncbi:MAG: lipoprotein signal peptidase [Acaryochloridaceae cyanobacterium RU_4_10]|nr:lipoprotein signal peptidase [Acaryochloridaceae cyanobacterium RU_4_10]
MKLKKNPMFWLSAVLSFLLDRLSKQWIVDRFQLTSPPQSIALWKDVFHITYVTNRGAAFSLFQGEGWLRWLSLVVTLGLIYYGLFGSPLRLWEQAGYGFLLGGAAGNGVDRMLTGQVVDFLDFRLIHFPVFNLADIAINIGLACLFVSLWIARKPDPKPTALSDRADGRTE